MKNKKHKIKTKKKIIGVLFIIFGIALFSLGGFLELLFK